MSIDIESLNDEAIAAIIKDQIDKRNFDAVRQYSKHKSPNIRSFAINSLSKFAYEIDIKEILKKGIKDKDQEVRFSTLSSLEKIFKLAEEKKQKMTINPDGTITIIDDPEGLMDQFNTKYFPIILTALNDNQKRVILEALSLLEKIGNPVTVGYLVKLLKTDNEELKQTVTNLLKQRLYEYDWGTDSKEALEPLLEALRDNDPFIRINAVNNLKVTGVHGHKYLLKSLKDKDPGVRKAACTALSNTGDPLYLTDLIEMTKDENREVRYEAKNALVNLLG